MAKTSVPQSVAKMGAVELKRAYKEAWSRIFVNECYGVDDCYELDCLEAELENRGYTIYEGMPRIVRQ